MRIYQTFSLFILVSYWRENAHVNNPNSRAPLEYETFEENSSDLMDIGIKGV